MTDLLSDYLQSCLEHHTDAVLEKFVHHLELKFSNSISSVLFYGSCMRSRVYHDAMLDFYVVVDNYKDAYNHTLTAIANKLLPPNVYYLQVEHDNQVYRSKYAVVSKKDLLKNVSASAFHSYFWARFTQPISYAYIREENEKQWIATIQCQSAKTFFKNVMPVLQDQHNSEQLWVRGLQLTYSAELRTETSKRAISIYQSNQAYYDKISEYFFESELHNNTIDSRQKFSQISWKLRVLTGKVLSILRLMKASMTFANGVDYIAWKIERHTGEKIEVSNNLRKYPWIFSWPMLIRLYLSGKIR